MHDNGAQITIAKVKTFNYETVEKKVEMNKGKKNIRCIK